MRDPVLKLIQYLFIFVLSLNVVSSVTCVSAQNCDLSGRAPLPSQIICPVIRIVNVALILGGVVLAIMIGVGAIKLATALGDPKGYHSAVSTLFYALVGVFIVMGVFAIIFIINETFGINLGLLNARDPSSIFIRIQSSWIGLLREFWIFER